MENLEEWELRERKYERLMKQSFRFIKRWGLEPVHNQVINFILEETVNKGYTRHIRVNINQFTKVLSMDKQKILDDLEKLSDLHFQLAEDETVALTWGEYELKRDTVTIIMDEKLLELFMRYLGQCVVERTLKVKGKVVGKTDIK